MSALLLFAALLLTAGCGFQLRSSDNWPAEKTPVFVESPDKRSLLVERINRDLLARDVETSSGISTAKLIISILNEVYDRRPLTVGVDGRVREYEIIYTVNYAGHNQNGLLLAPEGLTLRRIYAFDPSTILAKQREAEELREDLRKEMSTRLLQRFARLQATPIVPSVSSEATTGS